MDTALKTVKKLLKKNDSESMKLKVLVKEAAKKIQDDNVSADQIKKWIIGSDKFCVEKKYVSLKKSSKKKRDRGGDKSDESNTQNKKIKRMKQDKSKDNISAELSVSEASTWRTDNKVVLKATLEDQEGEADASKKLNGSEAYFPYNNFSSTRCKESIHEALLRQCTEVNGFQKPSAIQAQCWPVLLHPGSDGKRRDVVGIAETGSG